MIVLGPLVALLALWLLGASALALAGARREEARTAGLEVMATDFVAGVVILAGTGMTTIALGWRLSLAPYYMLIVLLVTAAARRRRANTFRSRSGRGGGSGGWAHVVWPRSPRAQLLLAGAGALLLLLALSASQDRLVWDGWAFWTLKARILFHEGTLPPATLAPTGPYPYAHPDYPLALPLLNWWLYRHAGSPAPELASLAGALWFATLPPLVWAALRRESGEGVAALSTFGMAAFWPLALYAAGGYADIVIALALLGVVIEVERARRGDEPGSPIRLALYLTLAALAKNEGLALALIGTAVALVSMRSQGERRLRPYGARVLAARMSAVPRLTLLALPFLALAPWFILTRRLGLAPQHLAGAEPAIGEALARVPIVVVALGKLLLTRAWVPLPFLVMLALYAAARRGRLVAPAGWAVVGGYGAVIFGVYLTTALELEWLLRTTLDRLVGGLVPAVVVLAIWELRLRARWRGA